MTQLDTLARKWELEAQQLERHPGITTRGLGAAQALRDCAQELRSAQAKAKEAILARVMPRAAPGPVEGQQEAWEWVPATCVRCGRELRHPEYLNGAPFGRVCVRKELVGT